VAVFAGTPALYAVTPVRRSDRTGAAHGEFMALAYLDREVLKRLASEDWDLRIDGVPMAERGRPGDAPVFLPPTLGRDARRLIITSVVTVHDGRLTITLACDRTTGLRLAERTSRMILVTGLGVALLGLVVGAWLGWHWLRPIAALAQACRRYAVDPHQPLPSGHGLREAEMLAQGLGELVARLRAGQDDLAAALDRETTANAVHRRFLAQLAHEFGQPIRQLISAIERLEAQGGRLDPEDAAAVRHTALELEERFQEVLGLVQAGAVTASASPRMGLDAYLAGIATLLRPQAERRSMTVSVTAPGDPLPIDARLLSPVLINLAANALRAGRPGGTVRLSVDIEGRDSVWRVADDGPGIEHVLAQRIVDAFRRGEVMPGTPGLGLGLALALANVRALGGRLELSANGPGGVLMTIRLPLGHGNGSREDSSRILRQRVLQA
jgi:signal transduction histidine kinase